MVRVCAAWLRRFCVAGHDRGGRVAIARRLTTGRVNALAVLDVLRSVPCGSTRTTFRAGLLAVVPAGPARTAAERLLGAAPEAIIDHALGPEWGTPSGTFDPGVRAAYLAAISDAGHVHAICEEYRAAAGLDRDHDRADRAAGRRIGCPLLALWSAPGR